MLVAAPLLFAFFALDRVTAPAHFWLLFCVRVVASSALLGLARATRRGVAPVRLVACAVVLLCGTIEVGVFFTGGARSPYLTSNIAVLAGVGILVPLTVRQSIRLQLLGLRIALLPLLFIVTRRRADARHLRVVPRGHRHRVRRRGASSRRAAAPRAPGPRRDGAADRAHQPGNARRRAGARAVHALDLVSMELDNLESEALAESSKRRCARRARERRACATCSPPCGRERVSPAPSCAT